MNPLFTMIIHEIYLCLGCVYTRWTGRINSPRNHALGQCLENLGRGFFISYVIQSGLSTHMIYCIKMICGRVFLKYPCLR